MYASISGATNDKKEIAAAVSCSVMVVVFLVLVVVGVFHKYVIRSSLCLDVSRVCLPTR